MVRGAALLLAVVACHSRDGIVFEDANIALDAPAHVGAGPGGGLLDELRFAVVGDTRPSVLS
jgi:hypothetical protein